jgi:hypothetical protein
MITEQQILGLGFEKLDYSTDTEGVYEFKILRNDLSLFPPSHIYKVYWDHSTGFTIRGSLERPNNEGVKRRQTKTISCILTDISLLEEKLDVIIRSDMNNYHSSMTKK